MTEDDEANDLIGSPAPSRWRRLGDWWQSPAEAQFIARTWFGIIAFCIAAWLFFVWWMS